jgi:small subunit ribosomal protein S4
LHEDSTLDDVLSITVEQMLSRRLQSVVYFKGLAPSMRSARSLIVHGHISIGDQRMTVPGYKILRSEEEELSYSPGSPYTDPQHAFRKEMEERRMPGSSVDDQDQPDADAEFVEQIKADAESAPTIEDTIPKEGE